MLSKILLISVASVVWAWMELVPGDRVDECSEPGKAAHMMDYSDVQIIMESDTDFFLNGTLKILKAIHSPWKVNAIGERWYRDQWVPGIEKKIADSCGEIHKKMYPSYPLLKDKKGCPLEPGDKWTWNMTRIPLDELAYFPPNFAGKWRLTITGFFEQDGVMKTECGRMFGDLYESNAILPQFKV